jgi:hypothetical protein
VPLFVPGLTTNALSKLGRTGVGDGSGTGSGGLTPFAALKGQLDQRDPKELFRIRVNAEASDLWYVRLKVLERYTSSGWIDTSSRDMEAADAQLSLPYGEQRDAPTAEQSYLAEVNVSGQFRDDSLPTFFTPLGVAGLGDEWEYNWHKAVLLTGSQRVGGFSYRVNGFEQRPTREQLVAAPDVPENDDIMQTLGRGLGAVPPMVRQTVQEITAGKTSPYERALELNDYFTDGTHGFTYSTSTKTGDGRSALVDFLTKKQGFCEQYAAAMAVMLRLAGIPSRVVLGYTHKRQSTDGVWSIYTDDAHAWVEAYFSGIGWVPFDPTPLRDGRSINLPYAPHPGPTPTTNPSLNSSSTAPSTGPGRTGPFDPNDVNNQGTGGGGQRGLFTPKTALGSLGVLVLIALLLLPGLGRIVTRRRRLRVAAGGDPAVAARTAWDEVLASAEDYAVAIPDTESPRRTATRLPRELSLDSSAVAGLRLTALAEERARYAPVAGVDGDLPTAVRAVRRGLRGDADGRRRWRAALMPPSTIRAARTAATVRAGQASLSLSSLIEGLRAVLAPRRLFGRRARAQS